MQRLAKKPPCKWDARACRKNRIFRKRPASLQGFRLLIFVTVHPWGDIRASERGRPALVASPRARCPRSQKKYNTHLFIISYLDC
jgi:hypothetical protein